MGARECMPSPTCFDGIPSGHRSQRPLNRLTIDGRIHQVQHVRDDLSRRVVSYHVAVIVAKTVSPRRRRQSAIVRRRHRSQTDSVRKTFARAKLMPAIRVLSPSPDVALIVRAEALTILDAKMVISPIIIVVISIVGTPILILRATAIIPAIVSGMVLRHSRARQSD